MFALFKCNVKGNSSIVTAPNVLLKALSPERFSGCKMGLDLGFGFKTLLNHTQRSVISHYPDGLTHFSLTFLGIQRICT